MMIWYAILGASLASLVFGSTLIAHLAWQDFCEHIAARKAYAKQTAYDALRYVRVSDTVPDMAIPSLPQTVNFKRKG